MSRFTLIFTLAAVAFAPALRAGAQEALLIQDHYPWSSDAWQAELVAAGISYTEIVSADVASTDLTGYVMVITSSDQDSTYNTNIMDSFSDFEDYVTQGGVLVWSACTQSADTPYPEPPHGGTNLWDGANYADVADASHPLAAGVPDPSYGSYTAHNYFDGEPADADIVMTSQNNGEPVLYVIEDGLGLAIVSGLTWEFGWNNNQDNAQTLLNAIDWGWSQIVCDGDNDGYDRGACGGQDCDDGDATVYPGADEYCNGYDDDCDGAVDEDDAVDVLDWWNDHDHDGFGDASMVEVDCDQPPGYVANDEDCDDGDAAINPDVAEVRDGIDQDCDGAYDEGLLETGDLLVTEIMKDPSAVNDEYGEWFEVYNASATTINLVGGTVYDLDGDTFTVSSDLWIPSGSHAVLVRNSDAGINGGVAGDYEYGSWPLANGSDEVELEHFGVVLDTVIYSDPAWPDVSGQSMSLDPDAYDETLNDSADSWCGGQDAFGDGDLGSPGGVNPACCPDADGDGYLAAACGGQDCDDGDAAIHPGATEMCDGVDNDCDGDVDEDDAADALTFYEDADGDTYGDISSTTLACSAPQGYVTNFIDCDDGDPNQFPGADEYCNGEDDDCDGDVDEDDAIDVQVWYADQDGDGFGDPALSQVDCDAPADHVGNDLDCDDGDPTQYPFADELCNGEDDDCDGDVDEDDAVDAQSWWADLDGDGFGDPGSEETACDAPQDFVANADDCDDGDASQYPGADEVCNGEDDDCDGDVDEGALDVLTWYADLDGDGYGDPAITEEACDAPQAFVDNPDDCDDGDPAQYPGAVELCNGEDDDCDGDVDEDAVDDQTWYIDNDGDGFGDAAVIEVSCDQPPSFVANDDDCDDSDPDVNPAADEVCNGIDDDCDALTDELADGDGDGFAVCDGDCDDDDPAVNPDAEEVCDGIDNDCDPATDEEVDGDGDGVTLCQDDCDDTEAAMFPGNPEVCDLMDNDCDGALPDDEIDDDGDGMTECEGDCDDADALTYAGAPEQCDQIDNDCDGVVDNGADEDLDADGFNACQGDCDNNDPSVYPGATEICDGKDDDCDGNLPTDEADDDGDGWMVCDLDCDDTDADLNLDDADGDLWTTCDGDCDDTDADLNLDDADGDLWTSCDGDCDDGDGALNLDDADGDGWTTCEGDCDDDSASLNLDDADGDGWTTCDDDCDDDDSAIYPDAAEECDGVDNNCDGVTDDVDADGDGHPAEDCGGDDCDDGDPAINPDEPENCDDGIDNDCDGDFDLEDAECEDSGDDDDDDDDDTPGDCNCQNNQADTSPAALPTLLTAALAILAIRRRR